MLETYPAIHCGDYYAPLKIGPQKKKKNFTIGKHRKPRRILQQHSKSPYDKPLGGGGGGGGQHNNLNSSGDTSIHLESGATNVKFGEFSTNVRHAQCNKDCLDFDVEINRDKLNMLINNEKIIMSNPTELYECDSAIMDKVNGYMRDEAIFNLRFLHKGFFNLSPETFARAVFIVDNFITKVRVRPRYITCVATTAYYIAAKIHEEMPDQPSKDVLLALTRCGGTVDDFGVMLNIIHTKLGNDFAGTTAIEYARILMEANGNDYDEGTVARVYNRILVAMTSLNVYHYRMSAVAIAALFLEAHENNQVDLNKLQKAADLCNVDVNIIENCARFMQDLYSKRYQRTLPSSRPQMFWSLSRRTRSHLSTMRCTSITLDPIAEVNECNVDVPQSVNGL